MIRFHPRRVRLSLLQLPCFLISLLFLSGGCSSGEKEGGKGARPAVPVSVAVAAEKSVPVVLRSPGEVEASSQVTVRSQVPGVIARVHFREGDTVRQGDLLFTLDRRPFEAALSGAEADLEQNRVALKKAERDASRYEDLLVSGFVSREETEAARALADGAEAAVAAGEARVENARILLEHSAIRAPQGGRTGEFLVHPGTVVKANDAPDLVTIKAIHPVLVGFSLPEKSLAEVRRHLAAGSLAATALAPGDPEGPEAGVITFLDNRVDPGTGTIRLKGTFANDRERLWPGQFVEVRVILQTLAGAVVVPDSAVLSGQEGSYLFIVTKEGTAEVRPVKTGIASGGETVIDEGVSAGETVVTEGQQRLSPGARVQVILAGGAAPGAQP